MASGHVSRTNRPTHGCTDQACKREESSCQLGAVHTCAGFRTPGWDAIHALRRPASEKRQGRKSREVAHWRCRGCYGDLAAGFGLMRLDKIGCRDRFSAEPV
jgi:hypothetical protein